MQRITAKPKILCVDDDPDLLQINSDILNLAGYEVLEASTGNECLRKAVQERPDLILLDVNLPDMNGFDICRHIKRTPDLSGIYVILISGVKTSSDNQIEALELGADGYIVRPISGQELLARVQAMIRLKNVEIELRKSKELLREKVNMLEFAQNAGKIGIFEWLVDTDQIIWSKELNTLYGLAPGSFGGKYEDLLNMVHPRDRIRIIDELSRIVEEKEGRDTEFRILRKDGSVRWISLRCNLISDEEAEMRIIGINIDITKLKQAEEEIKRLNEELEQRVKERTRQLEAVIEELEAEIIDRKRAESALKESEEKFRAITLTAPDAILLIDSSGKISYWNPAAERVFGYKPEEAIGKDIDLFLAPAEYHEALNNSVFDIFTASEQSRGAGKALEFLAIKKDGTNFPVEVSTSAVNIKGKWKAVGIIRDITERKLDEATLRKYAEQLQVLSGRLIEIQESERQHMAHELHDEIAQSLTALKLLLEHISSLKRKEIKTDLNTAKELVKELLTKVRNMSLDLRPSMLDDLGLLPALLWYFDRYTTRTNVRVDFLHSGLDTRFKPEIETAVYRIVQEALTNAASYDEIKVIINATHDEIILCIEDKGIGLNQSAAEVALNTGIKWMQERIALLGGNLTVVSSPDTGMCLTAKIPMKGSVLVAERNER